MKKILTLLALTMGALSLFAQTLPKGMHFEVRNDTLYVVSTEGVAMPHNVVFQMDGHADVYKKIYHEEEMAEALPHPADSIHKGSWRSDHINVYGFPVDSLKDDTIYVDLSGFTIPVPTYVTSKFGWRKTRMHYGIDLKLQIGDSVRSAWDGQVRIVDYEAKGYGHYVVIRHENGLETVYGHLTQPLVDIGDRVKSGECIGLGGSTGRSTGPHLHWETRYMGNQFNPELVVDVASRKVKQTIYPITRKETYYHVAGAAAPGTQTASSGTTTSGGKKYYTVKQGDNLTVIAKRNNTTVKAICQLNGIKQNSVIRIGQKLRVK